MADSGMRPDEVYETTPKIPLRLLKDYKYNLINIVKCSKNLGSTNYNPKNSMSPERTRYRETKNSYK